MKLELENKIYESNIELEGHDAKINPEQLKKLWEMLANPYKDNISSIVREITSNCFDSHKEAGVDDAVVITLDADESGNFIKFSDVGTGLSPERIEKIYINYLTSSKEDSNDYIGAFGIGSKSPLSYTDMFYIDTVYEGIKYSYIMRKGDTSPRIDKIYEVPIKQRNGTDIKIYIKSQNASGQDNLYMGDIGSFVLGIRHQLAYFDNVYVQVGDKLSYLHKLPSLVRDINEFTIYEGEHYVYRSNGNAFLNLCLGKVQYPIDYSIVFPEISTKFNLPIGLKFDIGDLMVTYSREDIKYTQEVVDKIRQKFKLAVKELLTKLDKQWIEKKEYNDIFEYQNKRSEFGTQYFTLKISNKHSIDLSNFISENYTLDFLKLDKYKVNSHYHVGYNITHSLKNYNKKDIDILGKNKYIDSFVLEIPYFKPFEDYVVDLSSIYNYFNFKILNKKLRGNSQFSINKGVLYNNGHDQNQLLNFISSPDKYLFIQKDIPDKYIFGKKFITYIDKVLLKEKKDIMILKYEKKLKNYKTLVLSDPSIKKDKSKWRDFIILFQKNVEEPIVQRMTLLSDIDSKATQEWYNKYKKDNGLIAPKNTVVKDPSRILYKQFKLPIISAGPIQHYNYTKSIDDFGYTSVTVEKEIKDLTGKNNVYFTRDDTNKMFKIIHLLKNSTILTGKEGRVNFCMISKPNEKILITNKLMYTLDDFINDNKEDLTKLYFYTKYLTQSNVIDIKSYINKVPNEDAYNKSLVIYYLMGNDLLTPTLKKDQTIKNLVNTYDAFQGVQYKITDVHDIYKKLVEEVFLNSKIDFKKESAAFEKQCVDDLKGWKDELDSHYKYLSLIYTHTSGSSVEKESIAFFINKLDLFEELKIIKKDSFINLLDQANPKVIELKLRELYKTDLIFKEFVDKKSISTNWLFSSSNSYYASTDQRFKEYLTFYLQQYITYKIKK